MRKSSLTDAIIKLIDCEFKCALFICQFHACLSTAGCSFKKLSPQLLGLIEDKAGCASAYGCSHMVKDWVKSKCMIFIQRLHKEDFNGYDNEGIWWECRLVLETWLKENALIFKSLSCESIFLLHFW